MGVAAELGSISLTLPPYLLAIVAGGLVGTGILVVATGAVVVAGLVVAAGTGIVLVAAGAVAAGVVVIGVGVGEAELQPLNINASTSRAIASIKNFFISISFISLLYKLYKPINCNKTK
jgi:hypothetical protein